MAPSRSSWKKIGAAVAYAAAVRAATSTQSYQLSEEYTADNFLDKFDFFESTYTSGDSWDDTHGYVRYRNRADAERLGLVSTTPDGHIHLGADANRTYDPEGKGRDSVRITSKAKYNQGLMVATFSHMPAQACGAWPAFWSFADPWLTSGEIDYYEGWNLMGYNRVAMHTNETVAAGCALSTAGVAGTVATRECVQTDGGAGCGVQDDSGVWASAAGAVFAVEWTDAAVRIWTWLPAAVPADVAAGAPDPGAGAGAAGWGPPTLLLAQQPGCDLASSFADQQLVFNIDFCGDTAGSPVFWDATCSAFGDSCAAYVADNPSAFSELYFTIEGIRFYEMGDAPAAPVSSTAAVVSPTTEAPVPSSSGATSSSPLGGLLDGAGSVLDTTLDAAAPTPPASASASSSEAAAPTNTVLAVGPTETHAHSTGYVYATSTSTDASGSETTVVVVVDTTICPVTAATATAGGGGSSSVVAPAQTTPAGPVTTSTVFSTSTSTVASCAPSAASCTVGDVTTVVVAVSTTVCPVTAASSASSRPASTGRASSSSTLVRPSGAASPSSGNSPVGATTTTTTTSPSTTPSRASQSVVTVAGTEVVSTTDAGGELMTASGAPSSVAINWGSEAAGTLVTATPTGGGGGGVPPAVASGSQATAPSASASSTACAGLDCIVVSSGGSGSGSGRAGTVGAGGIALVVLAGAVGLF